MVSFGVLLRTSHGLEDEGFRVRGDRDTARALAAYILGAPPELVVLAVA